MTIPLMRNTFAHERETLQALSEWLAGNPAQLSMGGLCREFEAAFAAWQGRKYAVLFNSGGSANLALLQAAILVDWMDGDDRVGFSALTWATNVTPMIQMGMHPIPVDIDPCTLNISMATLADAPEIDTLFVTNALGYLGELDRIRDWCEEAALLLEDNCEALGSSLPAGKSGNFGMAATFSFFVAHHMSTIEGGMVCTDDADLAEMLVMVRANGWDRNLPPARQQVWRSRYGVQSEFDGLYTFYVPGFNLRPTEITGFLGLKQLDYLEENIATREAHYHELEDVYLNNPDFTPFNRSHMQRLSPFAFPMMCTSPALRSHYIQRFTAAGVEVRPMIAGDITRQPFFVPYADGRRLPGVQQVHERGFYFGLYPELTREDLATLKDCLGGR